MEVEEDLDTLLLGEEEGIDRRPSMPERQPLSHFGPRQGIPGYNCSDYSR